MQVLGRLQILTKFIIGAFVSIIYVPFPPLTEDILFSIIKNMRFHIRNGPEDDESVCGQVRGEQYGACDVAEEDGGDNGDNGPSETNGFVNVGESEPDEGENEKSS